MAKAAPHPNKAGNPGEPLYRFDEIAQRLGTSAAALHAANTGRQTDHLPFWRGGPPRLYRLSDARKWWERARPLGA